MTALKLSAGKGNSDGGPIIDQARPAPVRTPAADRYTDVKSEPNPVYTPDAVRNPFPHPGKGGEQ